MSSLNTALKIFKKLLDRGQLDRDGDGDLFLEYRNGGSQIHPGPDGGRNGIHHRGGRKHSVPVPTATVFWALSARISGMDSIRCQAAGQLPARYIVMVMLYLFYGGRNRNPKQRDYLRVSKLLEELDQRLGLALLEQEGAAGLEERYGINFVKIAELWESKQDYEEKARKTKTGTILNTCRLLERHNLIRLVDNEREIRCTRKLDDLMLNYYLSDSRVEEIQAFFEGGGEAHA